MGNPPFSGENIDIDTDKHHIVHVSDEAVYPLYTFLSRSYTRWVGRQDSVGPAPPFFDSGGPQTGVWSTKTTKDGKCLSVIFIFLVENQYGLS